MCQVYTEGQCILIVSTCQVYTEGQCILAVSTCQVCTEGQCILTVSTCQVCTEGRCILTVSTCQVYTEGQCILTVSITNQHHTTHQNLHSITPALTVDTHNRTPNTPHIHSHTPLTQQHSYVQLTSLYASAFEGASSVYHVVFFPGMATRPSGWR